MATQTFKFHMEMTCEGCANAAKKVLGKKGDAVTDIKTDVDKKVVEVTTTLDAGDILETLKKTGKSVEILVPAQKDN